MRVIAGIAKGRRLIGPEGSGTRPMTDRAREALFSSLGDTVVGTDVLDLYAGSGSIGLEALSRGAATVVFVERDKAALRALRRNIEHVGLGGAVVATDVERYLHGSHAMVDLAFVDPPYALSLPSVQSVLRKLIPRLNAGAGIVVHRRAGSESPVVDGLELADRRRYGDTVLWRFRKETA
jgi:16S rRNA (guanine966-N2)-methyltransferase